MKNKSHLLPFLALTLFTCSALAQNQQTERMRKFSLALQTLGITPEKAPEFTRFPKSSQINKQAIDKILPYIDPKGDLRKYLQITNESITLYRDQFNPSEINNPIEFSLKFDANIQNDSTQLMNKIKKIASQVQNQDSLPLRGFKVMIDPGHMGNPLDTDDRVGKYLRYKNDLVVEGELNLWTAKLLANQLRELGAEVKLTRETSTHVTPQSFENYDPSNQIQQYFYKSLDTWMPKYLLLPDEEMKAALKIAPEVLKPYQNSPYRMTLYLQEDLNARMNLNDAFKPDLFIDIHYNAYDVDRLQSVNNYAEVYVPGGIMEGESSSRVRRAYSLKHLLDANRWNASVEMASFAIKRVSKNLNIPIRNLNEPQQSGKMIQVKEGVLARNLFQTSRNTEALTMFFESLHYDHTSEFYQFLKLNRTLKYQGKAEKYPERLKKVANGIRAGIMDYFNSLRLDD